MKQNQLDFTNGPLLKQLIVFSGPIMITNLLQTSYQLVDSLWIGNLLGGNALGSVAIAGTILFTVLSLVLGLNNAVLTILSQQRGRKDEQGLIKYLNAFMVLFAFLSLLLSALGILLAPTILLLLGTPESMMEGALAYLQIHFLGLIFLVGYNFISTVLRALGDSKTPLKIVGLAVGLNIVLDPVFIAVFNLGIEGAAYATLLSQGFAFLYGGYTVYKNNRMPIPKASIPAKEEIALIFRLGIPASLQMVVISAALAAIMGTVASFGETAVAGFSAAQRLDSLIMLPAAALGTAVNSMAGQLIGANAPLRLAKLAKTAAIYNLALMCIVALIILLLAELGVRLFIQDEEAVAFGRNYLQMIAFCYPFLGLNFVLNGIVRAAGAMYQVLVLNILSLWVLRYPLTTLFSAWFGESGIALGMGASFVLSSLFAYLYYRYGKWREKKLFT
ncbi:MATE family efflux transporter [Shouchella patagoniensis]|uniref:MATE family efflux transporter n=1 Tax=Shouchella patagoniensis TaxID=228576 RepID=UPI0009952BF0|nr:MATE family efflux transporter [Shouchella patagoniensis]